jgi:hypothetical protein
MCRGRGRSWRTTPIPFICQFSDDDRIPLCADGGHSHIAPHMSPSIGGDGGCEICGPFVAGLKKLYTSKIRPGVAPKRADPKLPPRHFFDWTVRDRPPSFPALSRSARSGCRCCKLLKSTIAGSRGSIGGDNAGRVSFRFSCVANARMRAGGMPFKEVQELSIGTTTPTGRAESRKGLGAIHVLRSDGECSCFYACEAAGGKFS